MGLAVVYAVGLCKAFELEGHAPFLLGPVDALRPQGVGGAHHIDLVPATVAALPLARIGVEKIAVQTVARHFIVESQGVVAGAAGTWRGQFGVHPSHEIGFGKALLSEDTRRNTR